MKKKLFLVSIAALIILCACGVEEKIEEPSLSPEEEQALIDGITLNSDLTVLCVVGTDEEKNERLELVIKNFKALYNKVISLEREKQTKPTKRWPAIRRKQADKHAFDGLDNH